MGGIAGAIFKGFNTSSASKKVMKAQVNAAEQNRAFATDMYNKSAALIQPTVARGTNADGYIDGLLGIGGDPAKSAAAWQSFRDSSGYQQQLLEGQNAIMNNNAARGAFQSGATAKGLAGYSAGVANASAQQYLQNLMGISNQGLSATSALLGQNDRLTGYNINSNNAIADAKSNNYQVKANAMNNMLGDIETAISTPFTGGFKGFGSSFGG